MQLLKSLITDSTDPATNERLRDMQTMSGIVRQLALDTDPAAMPDELAREVVERFHLYHAQVYVLKDDRLIIKGATGQPGREMVADGMSIALDDESSIAAAAARLHDAITVPDTGQSEYVGLDTLVRARSEIAVPLSSGSDLVGVLVAQSDTADTFTNDSLGSWLTLGGQVGVLMTHAERMAESQKLTDEARMALEAFDVQERYLVAINEALSLLAQQGIDAFNRVFEIMGRAAGVGRVIQFGYDVQDGKAMIRAQRVWAGVASGNLLSDEPILFDTMPGWLEMLQQGIPIASQVKALADEDRDFLVGQGVQAVMMLPLVVVGEFYGFLRFDHIMEAHDWLDVEAALLSVFANAAGAAMTARQLLSDSAESLTQSELRLELAFEIAREFSATTDIEELLPRMVDLTRERFNLYYAQFYRYDGAHNSLIIEAGTGEAGKQMKVLGHAIPYDAERSLVASAARNHAPQLVNDVHANPAHLPNPMLPMTRSEVAVPVLLGNELLGVLDVQAHERDRFNDNDVQTLLTLASQVAISLRNARTIADVLAARADLLLRDEALKATQLAIFITDTAVEPSPVVYANPYLEDLTGYTAADLNASEVGVNLLVGNDTGQDGLDVISQAILRRREGRSVFRQYRRDGSMYWAEVSVYPIGEPSKDGPDFFVNIIEDVTETVHAQERERLAYDLGHQLTSVLELDALLSTTLDRLSETFNYYHAHIYLLDAESGMLQVKAGLGEAGALMVRYNHSLSLTAERSLVARAARKVESVIVNNVTLDPAHLPNPQLPRTLSEVAVPLALGRRVIGVLDVQHDIPDYFTETEVHTLELIANQLAVSLSNAQLFEETQTALTRTELLYTGSDAVVHASTDAELLAVLTDLTDIGRVMDAAQVAVFDEPWLKDGEPPVTVRGVAAWQRSEDFHVDRIAFPRHSVPIQNVPIFNVMHYGMSPLFIPNLDEDDALLAERREALLANGHKGLFVFPLIVNEAFIGLLAFHAARVLEPFNSDVVRQARALVDNAAVTVNNRQLLERAQLARQETEIRASIERQLLEISSFQDIVDLLVGAVAAEGGPMNITMARFEVDDDGSPAESEIVAAWAESPGADPLIGQKNTRDEFPLVTTWADHKTDLLLFPDVQADPRISERDKKFMADGGVQALAILPITINDVWIGLLSINYPEPHHFTPVEATLLGNLIASISNASNTLLLFEEIMQSRDIEYNASIRQNLANRIAQDMAGQLDTDSLLGNVLEGLQTNFGYYYAHIYLLDEDREYLAVRKGLGQAGDVLVRQGHFIPLNTERSLVAQAARTRQSVTENNVTMNPHHLPNPLLPETRSEVAVPILSGSRVLGVLDVQHRYVDHFGPEEVQVLSLVASQLAVALSNARLFQATIQAEAEVRRVQEMSVDMIGTADLDGNLVDINPAWETVTGFTVNELLGQPLMTFIHPDDVEHITEIVNEARERGEETVQYESRIRTKAGGYKWLSSNMVYDMEDERIYFVLRDITEQRRQEARQNLAYEIGQQITTELELDKVLQETVNRLADAFEYYHAHFYQYDEDAEVLYVRAGLGEAGAMMARARHAIPIRAERSLVAGAARNREPVVENNVTSSPDHLPNPLLPHTHSEVAVPVLLGERVLGVLDVQQDRVGYFNQEEVQTLTIVANQLAIALSNAENFETLETRERYLQSLTAISAMLLRDGIERLPNALEILGQAVAVNRVHYFECIYENGKTDFLRPASYWAQAGFEPQLPTAIPHIEAWKAEMMKGELLTGLADDLTGAEQEALVQQGIQSFAMMPLFVEGVWIGFLSFDDCEKPRTWQDAELELLATAAASISNAIASARFVEQTVETAARLQELDQLKNEFLANMSHELRTPLNSIIGYSELLIDDLGAEVDEMSLEDLKAIHSSGHHLLALINDVLDLAKIEAGRMELNLQPVDIKQLVPELVDMTRVLLKEKPAVSLDVHIDEELGSINADVVRLRQVIWNLLSNAIKFTEEGSITVEVSRKADMALFKVADTGIGISEAHQGSIFDRFHQADMSATRKAGGTGLGLAVTRELVVLHGGDIWLESVLGEGATFFFSIPLIAEKKKKAPATRKNGRKKAEAKTEEAAPGD